MLSQHPLPFQNNLEHSKESSRRPRYHLHRSYTDHPDISPPNRATTAPIADKRSHLRRHELRHRPHHKQKQVPQSAVQSRPPDSPFGEVLGKKSSKSHGNTPAGSVLGSRRESLAVGGDDGQEEREKERDVLREKEKARKRNDELLTSLGSLSNTSISTTRRLDELYYSILEKLTAMHTTISSLQDLSTLTSHLQHDFQTQSEELESEVQGQIEGFRSFERRQDEIEELEGRVKTGREKVERLSGRLERVRGRVEGWERRESEWQKKTSQRLRMLWGVLASAVLLLLAIFIFHHLPVRHAGFPLARNMNTSRRVEEILDKHEDELKIPPNAKDVFREISSRAEFVTEPTSIAQPSSRLPDTDPRLKVLDEL